MKKKFIISALIAGSAYLVLTGYSAGPSTGFPMIEGTGVSSTDYCGTCHGISSSFVTNSIALHSGATPVTSYTPGGSYTIVMTGQYASSTPFLLPRFGFQLSARTSTANAGTMTAIAGTHSASVGGINLIEHSSAMLATTGSGAVGSTYVVNIPWTAPATGTGNVTLRGVINAVNFDGMSGSSDQWKNASLVVPEATPAIPPIAGTGTVCVGGTTTLTHPTAGGTWSSATPAVATVGVSSGIVTGVTAGTAVISYTVAAGTATKIVTVSAAPDAVVTGGTTVCVGNTMTLGGTPTGGTWTSAAVTKATVGSSSGIVTGVAVGTAVIKYKVTNACGTDSATVTMNVVPAAGCPTSVPAVSTVEEGLKVFPNPNYGNFTIAFSSIDGEQARVVISNVIGVQVQEVVVPANGRTGVNLNTPAGMYIITATTSRKKYVTRVSVE